MHSWDDSHAIPYEQYIEALRELYKLEIGITDEMNDDMKAQLKYLGSDLETRGDQREAPARTTENAEFAAILQGLPEHLPPAVVGGCRNAWKWFKRLNKEQYGDGDESAEGAILVESSTHSSRVVSVAEYYQPARTFDGSVDRQEHLEDGDDDTPTRNVVQGPDAGSVVIRREFHGGDYPILMGRLGYPHTIMHDDKVLTIKATGQVGFSSREDVAPRNSGEDAFQGEVIFLAKEYSPIIYRRETDKGGTPAIGGESLVGAGRRVTLEDTMSTLGRRPLSPNTYEVERLHGRTPKRTVGSFTAADSVRAGDLTAPIAVLPPRVVKGLAGGLAEGRGPVSQGVPRTAARRAARLRREEQVEKTTNLFFTTWGSMETLSTEDQSEWTETDILNGTRRGQLEGGGGPIPARDSSPDPYADPYAMSADSDVSNEEDGDTMVPTIVADVAALPGDDDGDSVIVTPEREEEPEQSPSEQSSGGNWDHIRQVAAAAVQRQVSNDRGLTASIPPLRGTLSERTAQAQRADQLAVELLGRVYNEAVAAERVYARTRLPPQTREIPAAQHAFLDACQRERPPEGTQGAAATTTTGDGGLRASSLVEPGDVGLRASSLAEQGDGGLRAPSLVEPVPLSTLPAAATTTTGDGGLRASSLVEQGDGGLRASSLVEQGDEGLRAPPLVEPVPLSTLSADRLDQREQELLEELRQIKERRHNAVVEDSRPSCSGVKHQEQSSPRTRAKEEYDSDDEELQEEFLTHMQAAGMPREQFGSVEEQRIAILHFNRELVRRHSVRNRPQEGVRAAVCAARKAVRIDSFPDEETRKAHQVAREADQATCAANRAKAAAARVPDVAQRSITRSRGRDVAPCPPPLSYAERGSQQSPPSSRRPPKRAKPPKGSCKPPALQHKDDSNTDDSDDQFCELIEHPAPSTSRLSAEPPATRQPSKPSRSDRGKGPAEELTDEEVFGWDERLGKDVTLPRFTHLGASEAYGPTLHSQSRPPAEPQTQDLFLSSAQGHGPLGKWTMDSMATKRDAAAHNRARNPPPVRPARRWQNPGHSASDDEDWADTTEMERTWGRGGIVRGQAFRGKWKGKYPLHASSWNRQEPDQREGRRGRGGRNGGGHINGGRGGYSTMPPLIADYTDSERENDEEDTRGSTEDEQGRTGPARQHPPLLLSSLQELADNGYHFHLLYKESGDSLTPAYSESNVRYPPDSVVPDDDGLYLCTDSEETRHLPIRLANKTREHREDFSLLGGGAPRPTIFLQNARPPNEDQCPKRHHLGRTCVVVVTRSLTSPAVLCGSVNYCTRYNSPEIPVSEPNQGVDLWDNADGLQPAVTRYRVPAGNARRIDQGRRDHSDSNRVQGMAGNHPQYDAEVDNVETPRDTPHSEPLTLTTRSFQRSRRSRHLESPQGFGTLNLAENQVGIVAYLQQHWEHLTKTTTPFQDEHRSAVWILPESTDPWEDPSRAVSMHALVKQTAVELGVHPSEVYHHVNLDCLDVWSRWGSPRNLPTLQEEQDNGPGAAEFATPLRELYRAYQHVTGSAPTTPPPEFEEHSRTEERRVANRPPADAAGRGRVQRRSPPTTTTRWSSRATAPASFRSQKAWAHFTYVSGHHCNQRLQMHMAASVYRDENTGQPTDHEHLVSITLVGDGRLHALVLRIWAGRTTLRRNAHFSRAWAEETTPVGTRRDSNPADASTYLYQLRQWCTTNRSGTSMGFPVPWDPTKCGCFATLIKEDDISDLSLTPAFSEKSASPSGSEYEGLRAPDPPLLKYPSTVARTEVGSPTLSRPWGTHLGVSISYNLLISSTKWKPGKNLVELLHHEMRKVRKAPPGISDSILHPDYRLERLDGTEPPIMPSNPRNTLRILPELGPVAPSCPGRICNRCEQSQGRPLRPVTNLYLGAWEGLPENNEVAYLCNSCLFPSCPNIRDWQCLEYRNSRFQATPSSRATPQPGTTSEALSGSVGDSVPPESSSDEDNGSDFPPTPRRHRTAHTTARVTIGSAMQTRTHHAPYPPAGTGTSGPTPASAPRSRVQFQPDRSTTDKEEKTDEYGQASETAQLKSVNELSRLTDTIDKTWSKMVTMYEGKYDDIESLAKFRQQVQDALLREGIFAGCVKVGIGFPDLLYRLLIVRIEPTSHMRSVLHPVWDGLNWRTKHLASTESMMSFLIKHCLNRQALANAERAYGQFNRKPSESAVQTVLRLRVTYNTACLCPEFPRRTPEHTLPETLVRGLDLDLHYRVIDGLKKLYTLWSREKLEKHGRISPEAVTSTLLKIQEEMDVQLHLLGRNSRTPTPAVSFQTPGNRLPFGGRRLSPFGRRTPTPKRSETAYVTQDTGEEVPLCKHNEETMYAAIHDRDSRIPTRRHSPGRDRLPPREPVGKLGPSVPPSSRPPLGRGGPPRPAGPRPLPDPSRQGRFTLGHENYGGCHNCGSKDHMAQACPEPPLNRIAALIQQEDDWTYDDAEAILEQGMPDCMKEYWPDTEEVYDYCQQLTGEQSEDDA